MIEKNCGSCTSCCEGHVFGAVNDKSFRKGKPCHYCTLGVGCSIYEDRPEFPCREYNCEWRTNIDMPDWLKPEHSQVLITKRELENNVYFYEVIECNKPIDAKCLNWILVYMITNKYNCVYTVEYGRHVIGSHDFCEAMGGGIVI